ncbi:bifunctional hydroxymethylpyrimidine kinase/phosphomethylpyrimidine kinase [Bacillus solimangrovi]|uniref:Hydroxymethylpyrimidine/phosphomethylpyrimidine kinase n=1 Tax=Bacillus solimangrovi TaxID=1305675 RepID=A0A1E5LB29_9BACI|nr:bifunctional hydroxymethylpyrimidine kinase/phosphomethylpyrimidine kinase [Bacillus solimangrovi]OEH91304.1 bifunctional hydroxymethylpyrimidine kinase/phosphomethylpyrimidine kinase [Bacillus solimangrovi]
MEQACALTIAGTDPSGGAGIQADLKTFQELDVYGMSVITSVVAQNTMGVKDCIHLPVTFIEKQLDSVIEDISPHAIKSGMIASTEMIELIYSKLANADVPYVIDPVMVATSGDPLIDQKARNCLREKLIPITSIVTPNIPEAEVLVEREIHTQEDMEESAKIIVHQLGADAVVVKGGHMDGDALDIFYDGKEIVTLRSPRFLTKHTHGTGCTFSAVITAELAKGASTHEAVQTAKKFISAAIEHTLGLGKGNGPTNHWAYQKSLTQKL